MMINWKFLISMLFACLFVACEKENGSVNTGTEYLLGYWINPQYKDSIIVFERSANLVENNYGFSFKPDHIFIERKNSGWCGTPPISYSDFDGTWEKNNSDLIINVGYWGGSLEYKWKIVSVNKDYLKIIK